MGIMQNLYLLILMTIVPEVQLLRTSDRLQKQFLALMYVMILCQRHIQNIVVIITHI